MEPTVGIIIPCYNEGKRLDIKAFEAFALENADITLIFANDGSTDNTGSILSELSNRFPGKICYFQAKENKGKAEVIRSASLVYTNHFDFIGYFDADLATPLSELKRMWQYLKTNKECLFLLGCRHQRLGVKIERSLLRHYLGRVFATLASTSLGLPVYDTQCGAKILESKIAEKVFAEPFVTKWFFDVEILKRILLLKDFTLNNKTIVEFPLNEWNGIEGSKVKLIDFLRTPLSLLKLHFHYYQKSK
ncbi:glycosyltransferase [Cytophagaceae bacterium ABcell3]|nr:glycosyltransferase [Cytophagaceae bacterium ABcell3]